MPISRYYVVAESRHELQNPTSAEKLVLLGRRLDLRPGSRVLDVASGRGGPALLLARTFECSVRTTPTTDNPTLRGLEKWPATMPTIPRPRNPPTLRAPGAPD